MRCRICDSPVAVNHVLGSSVLVAALLFGCATAENVGPDDGIGEIFADAGRVPPMADAGPKADASPGVDATPVDAAVLPDAPPAPDAAPGCTDVDLEVLTNANFDLGPGSEWVESSGAALDLVTTDFSSPHSGSYVGWLAGYSGGTDILYQQITVPAGATALSISGFITIGTQELFGAWDFADLELRTTTNALLEGLASWSNVHAASGWQSFSMTPVGDYQGQTIRLYMRAQTDGSNYTNFVFDSLSVKATVCQ